MQPRAHQTECRRKIIDFFAESPDNSRGLVKMFCGSGKSLVIYDIILAHGRELCAVVVPSIHLVSLIKGLLRNHRFSHATRRVA